MIKLTNEGSSSGSCHRCLPAHGCATIGARQDSFGCAAPRRQRAVEGGAVAVVAADEQPVAEVHWPAQVGRWRLAAPGDLFNLQHWSRLE